jgi:hypothetical protein
MVCIPLDREDEKRRQKGASLIDAPASLGCNTRGSGTTVRPSVLFDSNLDVSKIDANLNDGVLKLSIPRRAEALPRRIKVSVG